MEKERIQFYRKWHGKPLDDYCTVVSPEYKSFQRCFMNCLKRIADDLGARLAWFHPNHYDETAMLERDGKFCYVSHSNNHIRGRSTPVLHGMLIRSAAHEKDYHVGPNQYADLADLTNRIDRILGGKGEIEDKELFPLRQQYPLAYQDRS